MGKRTGRRNSINPRRLYLYLIVDGSSDQVFWKRQIEEHFRKITVKIHNLCGGEPSRWFDGILEDAKELKVDFVLFLTDEDAEPDPKAKVINLNNKVEKLKKNNPNMAKRVKVFGVRRGLESWLSADLTAVNQVFPKAKLSDHHKTDTIQDCKRYVQEKLYRPQYGGSFNFDERNFARKMACKIDFDRASKRSDSLASFWKEMKKVFT